MLRLSLLLTFVGLAVSALDGTSLLGMIRNDPNALVTIFETATADKDKVNTVINLLGNLVNEANSEIGAINFNILKAQQLVAKTLKDFNLAKGITATKLFVYNGATKATAAAQGRLLAAKKIHAAESPALRKEIEVFTKVISLLNGLLNGKNLVEEEAKQVKAFISLAEQADPVKVKKIIALLTTLRKTSQDELNRLNKAVQVATTGVATAITEENNAKGALDAAVKTESIRKTAWERARGALTITERQGNARKGVLNGEIKTLNSVIALLGPLAK